MADAKEPKRVFDHLLTAVNNNIPFRAAGKALPVSMAAAAETYYVIFFVVIYVQLSVKNAGGDCGLTQYPPSVSSTSLKNRVCRINIKSVVILYQLLHRVEHKAHGNVQPHKVHKIEKTNDESIRSSIISQEFYGGKSQMSHMLANTSNRLFITLH